MASFGRRRRYRTFSAHQRRRVRLHPGEPLRRHLALSLSSKCVDLVELLPGRSLRRLVPHILRHERGGLPAVTRPMMTDGGAGVYARYGEPDREG